jgi:hypothetical protein
MPGITSLTSPDMLAAVSRYNQLIQQGMPPPQAYAMLQQETPSGLVPWAQLVQQYQALKNASATAQQAQQAQQGTIRDQISAGLQQAQQQRMAPQPQNAPPMDAGVASLPVENVGDEQAYARGGIVAFGEGGTTPKFDIFRDYSKKSIFDEPPTPKITQSKKDEDEDEGADEGEDEGGDEGGGGSKSDLQSQFAELEGILSKYKPTKTGYDSFTDYYNEIKNLTPENAELERYSQGIEDLSKQGEINAEQARKIAFNNALISMAEPQEGRPWARNQFTQLAGEVGVGGKNFGNAVIALNEKLATNKKNLLEDRYKIAEAKRREDMDAMKTAMSEYRADARENMSDTAAYNRMVQSGLTSIYTGNRADAAAAARERIAARNNERIQNLTLLNQLVQEESRLTAKTSSGTYNLTTPQAEKDQDRINLAAIKTQIATMRKFLKMPGADVTGVPAAPSSTSAPSGPVVDWKNLP